MINKKNLWFLTLFSLILVLSIYYITMPSELLMTNNSNYTSKTQDKGKEDDKKVNVNVEESEILVALRVEANDQMLKEMDELNKILTNSESSVDEKNNAFEKMKLLNITRGEEESLENKILEEFNLKSFVKIDNDQIRVVISGEKLDSKQANDIMRSIQSNYKEKKYISIKFQK